LNLIFVILNRNTGIKVIPNCDSKSGIVIGIDQI
jgi:hypothetical protein